MPFLLFAVLLSIAGGCSGRPPYALRAEARPTFVRDVASGSVVERLAVYVQVDEEDGPEDVDSLWVVDDESGLYWEVQPESLQRRLVGTELWVGHSGLVPPTAAPRAGSFRVIVTDRAGNRSEAALVVPAFPRDPGPAAFPALTVTDSRIALTSRQPEVLIIGFAAGRFSGERVFPPGVHELAGLGPAGDALATADSWYAYARDSASGISVLAGPFTRP